MTEPTVLSMINDNLNSIAEDQEAIRVSVQKIDKKQAVDNQRLLHIEDDVKDLKAGQKKIKESVYNHANDKKKHYNQGYTESFPQKVWRKKDMIAIVTFIATAIGFVIENYFGG